MNNKLSINAQRISMLSFSVLSMCLTITMIILSYLTKTLNLFLNIECVAVTVLFVVGYNLITNQHYRENNIRIKWKLIFLGLKKVDWNKYDFHLTPVLTFSRVFHPSGLANSRGIALEWGHWAISIGRFKFLK